RSSDLCSIRLSYMAFAQLDRFLPGGSWSHFCIRCFQSFISRLFIASAQERGPVSGSSLFSGSGNNLSSIRSSRAISFRRVSSIWVRLLFDLFFSLFFVLPLTFSGLLLGSLSH